MQVTAGMIWSLSLTALVLAAVLGFLVWYRRKISVPCANVWGADPIGMAFAEYRIPLSGPLVACVTWLVISTAISLSPMLTGRGTYLLHPVQALVTLNYCLAVPILVGVYVYMVRAFGHFEANRIKAGCGLLLNKKSFWLFQLGLIGAALSIQCVAIDSEIDYPSPCSPWVTPAGIWAPAPDEPWLAGEADRVGQRADQAGQRCTVTGADARPGPHGKRAGRDLNTTGIVYYALRGLNTTLALGLLCTIFAHWLVLRTRFHEQKLTDHRYPGLGPSEHVQRVGAALLGAVVVGSVIATVYGMSLAAHARRMTETERLQLFTNSTWAFWAIATLIISIVAGGSIVWLRAAIVRHLRHREEEELRPLRNLQKLLLPTEADAGNAKARVEAIDLLNKVRAAISAKYCAAQAWPLPRGAIAALGFATIAQAGNILLALYTFSRNGLG